jgi:hypothetical protein
MFAGHIGAALAIGRAERRVGVGVFAAAALLLDAALWAFVLLGWESVAIPADFAASHQAEFRFPYSHGLAASLGWSLLAGGAAFAAYARLGPARVAAAGLVAAAVFSHWLLDALVHRAELPLAGTGSPSVGLGLWNDMPLAIAAEAAIVAVGLALFVPGAGLSRGRAWVLTAVVVLVMGFTAAGMTLAPPPPSPQAMAATSLVTLIAVCALIGWIARRPRGGAG